jgi:SAM-dependent methyltransferase
MTASSVFRGLSRLPQLIARATDVIMEHGPSPLVRWAVWRIQGKPGYPPMQLAYEYCKGNGIEFGAASYNDFRLPHSRNVAPFSDDPTHTDYNDFLIYKAEQMKQAGYYVAIDLVGDAQAVPVEDASQDYILSSHVVEHLPDLISAFVEWNRVLKPDGIILMIFPKRDALPNDATRPITPVEHFVEDYRLKQNADTHAIPEGDRIRGHYHVFTLESMLDLIQWCNEHINLSWEVVKVERTDSKVGNGHTVICRYKPVR